MAVIHRLADGFENPGIDAAVIHIPQNGHKLVATEPGNHIVAANNGFQAFGYRPQHGIAHGVTVLVVDFLEPVQVQETNRHRAFTLVRLVQFLGKQLCQPAAVRQPGQCVVVGGFLKAGLMFLALAVQALALQQGANRLQQRGHAVSHFLFIAGIAVGQTHQADHFIFGIHRHGNVATDRGVPRRQAAFARVAAVIVSHHHGTGHHGRTQQVVEPLKQHAPALHLLE